MTHRYSPVQQLADSEKKPHYGAFHTEPIGQRGTQSSHNNFFPSTHDYANAEEQQWLNQQQQLSKQSDGTKQTESASAREEREQEERLHLGESAFAAKVNKVMLGIVAALALGVLGFFCYQLRKTFSSH